MFDIVGWGGGCMWGMELELPAGTTPWQGVRTPIASGPIA